MYCLCLIVFSLVSLVVWYWFYIEDVVIWVFLIVLFFIFKVLLYNVVEVKFKVESVKSLVV